MSPTPFYLAPVEDQEQEMAFKVLNQDNIPMAFISEPILKPFDKSKPNVIVLPTRRINKNDSRVEDWKNIEESSHKKGDDEGTIRSVDKSYKTSDLKLKRGEKEEFSARPKKNPPTKNIAPKKPFVTTVKKGQFLESPLDEPQCKYRKVKEGSKKLYAFASRPRVLSRTPPSSVHQTRCEAAANAHAKYMGTMTLGIRTADNDESGLSPSKDNTLDKRLGHQRQRQVNTDIASSRAEEARRRSLARKKAKNQQLKSSQQIEITESNVIRGEETHGIEQFQKIASLRQRTDISTQTDERESCRSDEIPKRDVETQIYLGDLQNFYKELQPVIEVLVGRTIEQALIEVLEEEELATLREQHRRFIDVTSNETAESMRLVKLNCLKKQERKRNMVTAIVAQQSYRPQMMGMT